MGILNQVLFQRTSKSGTTKELKENYVDNRLGVSKR